MDFDIDCPADNPVFPGRVQSRPHLLYAVPPNEKASIRQLLDWLKYHHYSVIAKPGRSSDAGKAPGKVDFAVDLAVEALRIAPRIDHVVLWQATIASVRIVAGLQHMGRRVSVISTKTPHPVMRI